MRRWVMVCALCGLTSLVGCNRSSSSGESGSVRVAGGVAVIDLDDVARQLGREATIKLALTERETHLNQQLERLRANFASQINQHKQQSTEPTEGHVRQVQALEQQAASRIQQARQQAQTELVNQRRDLITAFREEIKPVARDVAAARGMSLVVSKNDTFLFAFDSTVDITQDVVARMKAQASSAPVATSQTSTSASAQPQVPSQPEANVASPIAEPGLLPAAPQRPLRGE